MTQVSVHEAKTHLSRLLHDVECGEEVIIARNGKPIAKIVPLRRRAPIFGLDRGKIWIADDFDETDPELIAMFEGDLDE